MSPDNSDDCKSVILNTDIAGDFKFKYLIKSNGHTYNTIESEEIVLTVC